MAQRSQLKKYLGCKLRFIGIVSRFGEKARFRGKSIRTVMLKQIREAGQPNILAEHVWLELGKWAKDLEKGDVISFHARVGEYQKDHKHKLEKVEIDYQLEYPTNVRKEITLKRNYWQNAS